MSQPGEGPFVPGQEPYVPGQEPYVPNEKPSAVNQTPYVPDQEPYVPNQGPFVPIQDAFATGLTNRSTYSTSAPLERGITRSGNHSHRVSTRKTASSIADAGWLDDDPADMTLSRRIALYLSEYNWYFPKKENDENAPDLAAAWAFFEHVTLPRYFVRTEDEEKKTRDIE